MSLNDETAGSLVLGWYALGGEPRTTLRVMGYDYTSNIALRSKNTKHNSNERIFSADF